MDQISDKILLKILLEAVEWTTGMRDTFQTLSHYFPLFNTVKLYNLIKYMILVHSIKCVNSTFTLHLTNLKPMYCNRLTITATPFC